MKVVVLIENNTINSELISEHGLSLYIEGDRGNILFDTGKSNNFISNAKTLGIKLDEVVIGVISHGHYDHGGGLREFLVLNNHAKVYMNTNAYGDFYSRRANGEMIYIGLDKKTIANKQIVLVDDIYKIAEGVTLVSAISGKKFFPEGNKSLLCKVKDEFVEDDFNHEQNLVIEENGKVILFAGCAHNGILNIVDCVEERLSLKVSHVFSGLHLYSHRLDKTEDPEIVAAIANELMAKGIKLWTGHCTGDEAFKQIKEIMKSQVNPMSTGVEVLL